MGINTATIKFRDDLLALINSSGLPICNVEMVMSSTLLAVREKLREAIKEESEVKPDE